MTNTVSAVQRNKALLATALSASIVTCYDTIAFSLFLSAKCILRLLPTWIGSMPRKPANLEKGLEDSSGPSAMLHIQLARLNNLALQVVVLLF